MSGAGGAKGFAGRWVYDQQRSESTKPIINALGMSEIAQLAADKIQIYYNIFDTEATWSVEVGLKDERWKDVLGEEGARGFLLLISFSKHATGAWGGRSSLRGGGAGSYLLLGHGRGCWVGGFDVSCQPAW